MEIILHCHLKNSDIFLSNADGILTMSYRKKESYVKKCAYINTCFDNKYLY